MCRSPGRQEGGFKNHIYAISDKHEWAGREKVFTSTCELNTSWKHGEFPKVTKPPIQSLTNLEQHSVKGAFHAMDFSHNEEL